MCLERGEGFGGEAFHRHAVIANEALAKRFGEERHIAIAFAQRGHVHGHHVQAEIEILPEFVFLNALLELAVGGGDYAHVHLDGAVSAHAFEFAFLQNAQQFALEWQGEFADFIEENGAAVGQLEAAFAFVGGAGEGSFFVPKEFAFHEVLRQRGAVELDEGAVLAVGVVVHRVGHEFLAGAVLALDEHGGVGLGDAPDEFAEFVGGFAFAEDFILGILGFLAG